MSDAILKSLPQKALKLPAVQRLVRAYSNMPEGYPYPDEHEYDVAYAPYQVSLAVRYHEPLSLLSILTVGGIVLPSKGGGWAMYKKLESKCKEGYLTFKYDMDVGGVSLDETNCWFKFSMGLYTEVTLEDYYSFIKGLDFIRPYIALNKVSFDLEVDETVNKEAQYRDSVFDLRVVDRTLGDQLTGQLADYFIAFGEKCPLVKPSIIFERYGPLSR